MQNRTSPPSLSRVILGGLALHGRLSPGAIMQRAEAMCLDAAAAARAVHDLIAQGLASVTRDGPAEGAVIATGKIADLPTAARASAITTYLAQGKAVRHG